MNHSRNLYMRKQPTLRHPIVDKPGQNPKQQRLTLEKSNPESGSGRDRGCRATPIAMHTLMHRMNASETKGLDLIA